MPKSVDNFNSHIHQAQFRRSPQGDTVNKAEVKHALQSLETDGKVSKAEVGAVKDLLDQAATGDVKMTRGARDELKNFVAANAAPTPAPAPTNPQDLKLNDTRATQLSSQMQRLLPRVDFKELREGLPVGGRFHSHELMREKRPYGFAYGVMIPVGALAPGAQLQDPNKVDTFYIRRKGGNPETDMIAGPFVLESKKPSQGGIGARIDSMKDETSNISDKLRNKILGAFNEKNADGNVKWMGRNEMPLGVRYERAFMFAERSIDGYKYNALLPAGALSPTAPKANLEDAKYFFVERSGGFAGLTQIAGPFEIQG